MTNMFDKIFNLEAMLYMINVSGETEDSVTIRAFREYLIERVDGNTIMKIAREWNDMEVDRQISIAFNYVGEAHASRFAMYLDYLSVKIEKGHFSGL